GREMSAADLWQVFAQEYRLEEGVRLGAYRLEEDAQRQMRLNADVEVAGRGLELEGQGNGPVESFMAALQAHCGDDLQLLDYHEHAIGGGAKARAAAYIELRIGTRTLYGVGVDADIVAASFKALLSGVLRAGALLPTAQPASVAA
ncbi:MAG: alpha-isopropylmalate synthase regulatory domain-containing protein, partial [Rubrivivax sp.]